MCALQKCCYFSLAMHPIAPGNLQWILSCTQMESHRVTVVGCSGQILTDSANKINSLPVHLPLPTPSSCLPRFPQTTWELDYSKIMPFALTLLVYWRRKYSGNGQPLCICYHHRGLWLYPSDLSDL